MIRKFFNLPKPVIWLGATSLLSDIASEAIYPLLPIFLTTTLGASPLFLGALEGFVESLSSLLKLVSGFFSDRWKKQQPFVFLGYIISNLTRPILAFALSPLHVLALRFIDRIGKGIRTAPRDAWLARIVSPEHRGRAFGFHRGMDNAGATIAPLLASMFLLFFPENYRGLFFLTIIPGFIALLTLRKASQAEPPEHTAKYFEKKQRVELKHLRKLSTHFRIYLAILFLFSLSLATDAFLILKLHSMGMSAVMITLIWALHNGVRTLSSFWGGGFSDRVGAKNAIMIGWILYGVAYLLLGQFQSIWFVIPIFLIYGIYYGLTESAEKSLAVGLVPAELQGTALGFYHLVMGCALFPASLLFGWIWQKWGSSAAFTTSAFLALLATILFSMFASCSTELKASSA